MPDTTDNTDPAVPAAVTTDGEKEAPPAPTTSKAKKEAPAPEVPIVETHPDEWDENGRLISHTAFTEVK